MKKLDQVQSGENEEFTTYEDVFALALANTNSERFKANSDDWHRIMYEVCEKYRDKIPQLSVIFFENRPPLPPQSNEFYQLITTLSMSGFISLPNPNYEFIVMEGKQKKLAKKLEKKRLTKYKDYIQDITELLDNRLAVEG